MLSTLVIIAVLIYRAHKTRKMAVVGCAAGSVAMACMGMLTNYFLIIPFYVNGMGWNLDAIFELCSAVNPHITGMSMYLLIGVLPFNLIKGSNPDRHHHARLQKAERIHQIQAGRVPLFHPPEGKLNRGERSPKRRGCALFRLRLTNFVFSENNA